MAKHHVRVPPEQEAELARIAKQLVVPPATGLTTKNRERLRQFGDETRLCDLLTLPERLSVRARSEGKTYRACLTMEVAVALAILRHCPIRRTNLAKLRLDQNITRLARARA